MPFAYAIVGMGAFLAGATHAPLMAILMMFEMTLSYQVVLPLMLACVAAYFVARAVSEKSMYEVTIHRNREQRALARWRGLKISELIKPAVPTVPIGAQFAEIERAFLEHPIRYVYVIDDEGRFGGVVSLHEIKQRLLAPQGAPAATAGELMRREFAVLTPETALGDALQMFLSAGRRAPAGGKEHGRPPIARRRFEVRPAARDPQPYRLSGRVASPGPSGRCMITLSTQRPNLKPTERSVPTRTNPCPACSAMDGVLALSPITATSCRYPSPAERPISSPRIARPTPRPTLSDRT